MKKFLLSISAAAILLAACNSDKKSSLDTDKQIVFSDTSSLNKNNASTDVPAANTATTQTPAAVPAPQPEVRTVTKIVHVHDKPAPVTAPAQTNPPAPTQTAPVVTTPSTTPADAPVATVPAPSVPVPAAEEKKKGWSSAAKGATIGGVGGAVAGAVIGKGVKGAVIGGVIGAAGGYILGRKADNKKATTTTTTP